MTHSLKRLIEAGDVENIIQNIPYAQTIGMKARRDDSDIIYLMPAQESNIGNPTLPALHGGCIGGFMETAAILEVIYQLKTQQAPKVINFSLDYLRPGRLKDTYARCRIVRQGSKVVNVSISAWQDRINEPIANARTHLLL